MGIGRVEKNVEALRAQYLALPPAQRTAIEDALLRVKQIADDLGEPPEGLREAVKAIAIDAASIGMIGGDLGRIKRAVASHFPELAPLVSILK